MDSLDGVEDTPTSPDSRNRPLRIGHRRMGSSYKLNRPPTIQTRESGGSSRTSFESRTTVTSETHSEEELAPTHGDVGRHHKRAKTDVDLLKRVADERTHVADREFGSVWPAGLPTYDDRNRTYIPSSRTRTGVSLGEDSAGRASLGSLGSPDSARRRNSLSQTTLVQHILSPMMHGESVSPLPHPARRVSPLPRSFGSRTFRIVPRGTASTDGLSSVASASTSASAGVSGSSIFSRSSIGSSAAAAAISITTANNNLADRTPTATPPSSPESNADNNPATGYSPTPVRKPFQYESVTPTRGVSSSPPPTRRLPPMDLRVTERPVPIPGRIGARVEEEAHGYVSPAHSAVSLDLSADSMSDSDAQPTTNSRQVAHTSAEDDKRNGVKRTSSLSSRSRALRRQSSLRALPPTGLGEVPSPLCSPYATWDDDDFGDSGSSSQHTPSPGGRVLQSSMSLTSIGASPMSDEPPSSPPLFSRAHSFDLSVPSFRKSSSARFSDLCCYVPTIVLRHYLRHRRVLSAPRAKKLHGAVLFVDMSGFTKLTESLSNEGAGGVERMSTILSNYFMLLIRCIHSHGGDVIKFAGDALIVLWPLPESVHPPSSTRASEVRRKHVRSKSRSKARPSSVDDSDHVPAKVLPFRRQRSTGSLHSRTQSIISESQQSSTSDPAPHSARPPVTGGSASAKQTQRKSRGRETAHPALDVDNAYEEHLREQSLRATQCALHLHMQYCRHPVPGTGGPDTDDVLLSLHSAVGAGELYGVHIGGHNQRWEFLLASTETPSAALTDLWLAVDQSKKGEVVLSPRAAELLADAVAIEPSVLRTVVDEHGNEKIERYTFKHGCGCVERVLQGERLQSVPLERFPLADIHAMNRMVDKSVLTALRGYLPEVVLSRLDHKQDKWLAELRTLTITFIKLPSPSVSTKKGLAEFERVVATIQECSDKNDGTMRQLISDDKGTVVILAFGLKTTSDAALQAVRAAMSIRQRLAVLAKAVSIGVTTGSVFCGRIGSHDRREWVIIGDAVNTAARLMGKVDKMQPSRGGKKSTHRRLLSNVSTTSDLVRLQEESHGLVRRVSENSASDMSDVEHMSDISESTPVQSDRDDESDGTDGDEYDAHRARRSRHISLPRSRKKKSKRSRGGILCDESTVRAVLDSCDEHRDPSMMPVFLQLGSVPLKGKSGRVPIFRPRRRRGTGMFARATGHVPLASQIPLGSVHHTAVPGITPEADEEVHSHSEQELDDADGIQMLGTGANPLRSSVSTRFSELKIHVKQRDELRQALESAANRDVQLSAPPHAAPGSLLPPAEAQSGSGSSSARSPSSGSQHSNGQYDVVMLEALPGMGLRTMVSYAFMTARKLGLLALAGSGDRLERRTPYFCFGPVLHDLLHALFLLPPMPLSATRKSRAHSAAAMLQVPTQARSHSNPSTPSMTSSTAPSAPEYHTECMDVLATMLDHFSPTDSEDERPMHPLMEHRTLPSLWECNPTWPIPFEYVHMFSLLNGIVAGLSFPEDEYLAQLSAASRAVAVQELVVRLFRLAYDRMAAFGHTGKIFVVLQQFHTIDVDSEALLLAITQRLSDKCVLPLISSHATFDRLGTFLRYIDPINPLHSTAYGSARTHTFYDVTPPRTPSSGGSSKPRSTPPGSPPSPIPHPYGRRRSPSNIVTLEHAWTPVKAKLRRPSRTPPAKQRNAVSADVRSTPVVSSSGSMHVQSRRLPPAPPSPGSQAPKRFDDRENSEGNSSDGSTRVGKRRTKSNGRFFHFEQGPVMDRRLAKLRAEDSMLPPAVLSDDDSPGLTLSLSQPGTPQAGTPVAGSPTGGSPTGTTPASTRSKESKSVLARRRSVDSLSVMTQSQHERSRSEAQSLDDAELLEIVNEGVKLLPQRAESSSPFTSPAMHDRQVVLPNQAVEPSPRMLPKTASDDGGSAERRRRRHHRRVTQFSGALPPPSPSPGTAPLATSAPSSVLDQYETLADTSPNITTRARSNSLAALRSSHNRPPVGASDWLSPATVSPQLEAGVPRSPGGQRSVRTLSSWQRTRASFVATLQQQSRKGHSLPVTPMAASPLLSASPIGGHYAPNIRALLLRLHRLQVDGVRELSAYVLGAERCSDEVAELVWRSTEGNVLFVKELVKAAVANGSLKVVDGVVKLGRRIKRLLRTNSRIDLTLDVELPATVRRMIADRISALPSRAELLIKVASVCGRVIHYKPLYDVYPVRDRDVLRHIKSDLKLLCKLEVLVPCISDCPPQTGLHGQAFVFKQGVTQRLVYEQMTNHYRSELHFRLAGWFRSMFEHVDLSEVPQDVREIAAHHWFQFATVVSGRDPLSAARSREFARSFCTDDDDLSAEEISQLAGEARSAWLGFHVDAMLVDGRADASTDQVSTDGEHTPGRSAPTTPLFHTPMRKSWLQTKSPTRRT